jgi:hypothetical protein
VLSIYNVGGKLFVLCSSFLICIVILDVLVVILHQCCAGGDVISVLSIYNVGGKLFVLCWSFLICIGNT